MRSGARSRYFSENDDVCSENVSSPCVPPAVDKCDVNARFGEALGGPAAGRSGTHDNDVERTRRSLGHSLLD